jgi:hypothetical protein
MGKATWRSRNILICAFVVLISAIILSYLLALSMRLDGLIYLPQIQEALDSQCGRRMATVNFSGYFNDPSPSWTEGVGGIMCYWEISDFKCSC